MSAAVQTGRDGMSRNLLRLWEPSTGFGGLWIQGLFTAVCAISNMLHPSFLNFQWGLVNVGRAPRKLCHSPAFSFLLSTQGCWCQLFINGVLKSWQRQPDPKTLLWHSPSIPLIPLHPPGSAMLLQQCTAQIQLHELCYLSVLWAAFQTLLNFFCMHLGFEKYKFKTKSP